jgi:hypothetical protein
MKRIFIPLVALCLCACPARVSSPLRAVVDCAKEEVSALSAEIAKLAALAPDWAAIYRTAVSDIETSGINIAGCALARVTHQRSSTERVSDSARVREQFSVNHAGGATFDVRGLP